MRFKRGPIGYLKLGFIFMIFSSMFTSLLMLVVLPMMLGGFLFGGLEGTIIMLAIVIVIMIMAQGFFVHWFYRENKFVK
jgi:hypothetical protein